MPNTRLLPLLANGEFHSGQDLAQALGVSRTAVWKQLNKLEVLGLKIESVKGRGYRIPGGVNLIDSQRVREGLGSEARDRMRELDVQEVLDSTNLEAQRRIEAGAPGGLVCIAEQQTAGRGRRGRPWVSPFARNLYLSVVWDFTRGAAALEGLSLAVGVAVVRALNACGVPSAQLKWPNDVLFEGKKLGGILLEMVGDATGHCQVVVGIGVNVAMSSEAGADIDQAWTDVQRIMGEEDKPDRNTLLSALLNELLPMLASFEREGFVQWRDSWQALDALADQAVILSSGPEAVSGVARGVDDRGALLLETSLGVQAMYGGEISLRAAQ